MKRRVLLGALSALGISAAVPALAQASWPQAGSTIRYVVPFPPGGLTDVMARLVAQHLGPRLKANVVVDNRPGSGGMIGADAVAKSAPDGQTLLAITMTHSANATLFKGRAPYDFEKDLKPVALLAGSPILIVVPASSPIKDLKDLVAQAKAKPLNAGSSGNGTPPHLALALFNQIAKGNIQHIPYKGGAPSMNDLIGGQLDVIFSNFPESIAHVKAGKLRALAIASPQRHPNVPDVPTTAEAGLPQLQVDNWTAIMVPAATPDAIVNRLSSEVVQIMQSAEVEERARALGFRVDPRPARDFAPFLRSEVQRWGGVIQAAGIRPD